METIRPLILACLLTLSPPVLAAEMEHQHHHHGSMAADPAQGRPGCPPEETKLACATQASPAFLTDGHLILVWTAGGRVMTARSPDGGASFEPPVAANPGKEQIDTSGEARPAIATDSQGRVFVAWALRKDAAYSGTLMLARSVDGGRSFQPPKQVASDPASQRFPTLRVDGKDRLYLAWIDKREGAAAKKAGKSYRGAALAMAWSDDGADTFTFEGIAHSNSCECCRIAMDFDPAGRPIVMWRHVFEPNIRDHAIMAFTDRDHPGPIRKIAEDDWRVDACPHAGPALAVAADGSVHGAWYSGGGKRKGLFLASAANTDAAFSAPLAIGDSTRNPASPHLLSLGARLWLAWKEFDGEVSSVMVQSSEDGGKTWSAPHAVATAKDTSDRPILLAHGGKALLSWMSAAEGWRLVPLE